MFPHLQTPAAFLFKYLVLTLYLLIFSCTFQCKDDELLKCFISKNRKMSVFLFSTHERFLLFSVIQELIISTSCII